MTETELRSLLAKITPPDEAARKSAHAHWASLAKPLGGLGRLETMLEDAAALTGRAELDFSRRAILVLCADNGVAALGVSQTGQEVTRIVAENLVRRRTSVCCMAAAASCEVLPVDLGIAGGPVEGLLNRRIADGTADCTLGPAMSRRDALRAIETGIELVRTRKQAGFQLLATGEMGIANTTTSSAVACALLGRPAREMTGRGAGLSDAGLRRKIRAVETALTVNRPDPSDPLDVLAKVGGFDLAALCAVRLAPHSSKAIFASHCSSEPAARQILTELGKEPLLMAGMHLGEGTGAAACIPLWDAALAVYRNCYSFEQGGIPAYTPQGGLPC